jgi:membrane-bound lytic murein transglycosylase A
MSRLVASLCVLYVLAGCAPLPPRIPPATPGAACTPNCPCTPCPSAEVKPPPAPPYAPSAWTDLPGWGNDDLKAALTTFAASCNTLARKPMWRNVCVEARGIAGGDAPQPDLRVWFESRFQPWQLVNPDGSREGTVTGYYEPLLHGSRERKPPFEQPVYGVPSDLLVIDLADVYPELKGMRLRGRLEGRKVVPYATRAELSADAARHAGEVLLWTDDAVDLFFMQIQGSGQVQFDDGSSVRLAYADQNGYPYKSVGKWLVEHGEMSLDHASMQSIKAWALANPQRLQELLNVNPSVVFFRELPVNGSGPPGALGVPLTPERSIAVDARTTPLGAPVWLATSYPDSDRPLDRLMLAQDTGGAIRGPVRADFYWGSGAAAGEQAGRMRQNGRMWILLPMGVTPEPSPLISAAPK